MVVHQLPEEIRRAYYGYSCSELAESETDGDKNRGRFHFVRREPFAEYETPSAAASFILR
jgi:hypothetical protein